MATGRWVRAARRARRLSQRELAARAGLPLSTIGRVEAGRTTPRLDTFVLMLAVLGYELVIVDRHGEPLVLDDEHDRLRDHGGRRFPAHLVAGPTPGYFDPDADRTWWGWERIAWPFGPGTPPSHTFWRRPERRPTNWDDAT